MRSLHHALTTLLTAWLLAPTAHADMIMQLQEPCPPPRVKGIRDHAEVCLDPPPEQCPAGWRGIIGGECMLDRCQDDSTCGAGKRCTDVPLCFESRPDPSCMPYRKLSSGDRSLLGAPKPMCPPGPSTYEEPTHPCGDPSACAGTCKPDKLCLAPGQTAAPVQPPPPAVTPRSGCAGCDVGGTSGSEAALAVGLLVSGLAALRGRKRVS